MSEEIIGRAHYRGALGLEAQVWTDPTETYTVVVISGERYAGVGVAKRNASDPVDPQIGYDIACARALRELADVTEQAAHENSEVNV